MMTEDELRLACLQIAKEAAIADGTQSIAASDLVTYAQALYAFVHPTT